MITKLIVASGKSAGRAISIKRNTLLIGRAEECDVRPLSEEVSRRHCAVHVGPADIWAEDLSSRNGTFVNGVRIAEKTKLTSGDVIRVGSLELKVSCTESAPKGTEDDVSKWLMADDSPAGTFDTTQSMTGIHGGSVAADLASNADADVDASNIHMAAVTDPGGSGSGTSGSGVGGSGSSKSSSALAIEALKEAKAKPGILPQGPKKSTDSSRDAAADALRKFFGNR